MNELLVWWFLFVNSNMDLIIMTITLIVVAGLVLEVVRLKNRVEKNVEIANKNLEILNNKYWDFDDSIETLRLTQEDQVKVNTFFANDIETLKSQIKIKRKK